MPEDTHFTRANAAIQAYHIKNYWSDQGYVVDVRIEKFTNLHADDRYTVRSNLINGLPPGYKFSQKAKKQAVG